MEPVVFAMPGGEETARRVASELSWQYGELLVRRFPDGESHLQYRTPVAGRDVAIVCMLDRPDEKVMPLYLAASIARELGASRVGLVLPYLAYMRQDARFHEGEGITSVHFARLLSWCCDWLVTVDPHLHRHHSLGELYPVPAAVAHAAPAISQWVRSHVAHPFVIGPDAESEQWVAEVARGAGCGHTVLTKIRRGDRDIEVSLPDFRQLAGKTPVLVDDIVSTARTMEAAVRHLRGAGLAPPVCIAVHALFVGDAYELLRAAGAGRVVSCDTVPHPTNAIGLGADLAAAIRSICTPKSHT